MNDELTAIGDALQRAIGADLNHSRRRRLPARSPRLAVAAAAAVIAVPAVAYAATNLLSTTQVAASLPQGTKALIGTDPSCTVVTAGVEYHCVLASAPSNDGAPASPNGSSTTSTTDSNSVPKSNQKVVVEVVKANGSTQLFAGPSLTAVKSQLHALGKGSRIVVLKANGAVTVPATPSIQATTNNGVYTTTTVTPAAATPSWNGTVEPTVDGSKHVNGGCRALNAAGTAWDCFIGEAAVKQGIIGQDFLGQYAPAPGVG